MCRIRFSPMLMILKSIIDLLLAFPYPVSIFPPECPTDLPDASQPACLRACLSYKPYHGSSVNTKANDPCLAWGTF